MFRISKNRCLYYKSNIMFRQKQKSQTSGFLVIRKVRFLLILYAPNSNYQIYLLKLRSLGLVNIDAFTITLITLMFLVISQNSSNQKSQICFRTSKTDAFTNPNSNYQICLLKLRSLGLVNIDAVKTIRLVGLVLLRYRAFCVFLLQFSII